MAQNIVSLGFNIDELNTEKKQVLDIMLDLFGKLEQYDGTRFNPLGGGGLADLKKSLTDGAQAMNEFGQSAAKYNALVTEQATKQAAAKKSTDDLTLAEKEHKKNLDAIILTKAKLSEADTNAANDKAIEAQKLRAVTAEVNANAKAYLSQINSINEARASTALLKIERDKLSVNDQQQSTRIKEINALIEKNDAIIKENTSTQEQQKANVGNYTGALQVLEAELAQVNAKLEQMTAAGQQGSEAFASLEKESSLLNVIVGQQQKGFASVTQEIRNSERALQTLRAEGFGAGEAFDNLRATTVEAAQAQKEFQRQQKLLEGEAPALGALILAAKGLGGAYAIGAGAAQLFAADNEKVQKELNKLVAIMTLLQGLNEAYALVQQFGAVTTALKAAEVKGLTIATELYASVTGTAVVATESLEAALIGTGVGALIAVIAAAVGFLAYKLIELSNADNKAAKDSAELAASLEKVNSILIEQIKLSDEDAETQKKNLTDSIALAEKNKQNYKDIYVIKKAQADLDQKTAEHDLTSAAKIADAAKAYQKVDDEVKSLTASLDPLLAKQSKLQDIQDIYASGSRNGKNPSEIFLELYQKFKTNISQEDAKTQQESVEKEIASTQKLLEEKKKLIDNYDKTQIGQTFLAVEQSKLIEDEQRKIDADSAERKYLIRKDANDRILSLDTSTETERIAAVKGNYNAEEQLSKSKISAIEAEIQDRSKTEKEGADEIATIQNDLNIKYKKAIDERVKIELDFRNRNVSAKNSISKTGNESDAAIQEGITKDTQKELDDRLAALRKNIDDKTAIIVGDYNTQVKLNTDLNGKSKLTADEQLALEKEKDAKLKELTATTQKEIYDITLSYGEKKLKAVEDLNKGTNSATGVTEDYNKQVDDLNKSLNNQTISYTHYVNQKKRLDQQYAIDKDRADIVDDEASLRRIKDFEDNTLKIKLDAAQKELAAAVLSGNTDDIGKAQSKVNALLDIQKKAAIDETALEAKKAKDKEKLNADSAARTLAADKFLHDQEKQLEQASFALATQLVDASYENRINKIEKEIEKNDEQSQAEINAVQRSTLSTRDQAAEIIVLTAQQRARDTQYKREEKAEKIKEAKFDRDVAVAKALWAGAEAEIAAIGEYSGTPYAFAIAATIAALTAVQVATILAKPIPTYGEGIGIPGKGEHPGGLAWAGERFKPERVSIPGYEPFVVSTPTLIDMPKGTSVLPIDPNNLVFDLGGSAMSRGAAVINNRIEPGKEAWAIARWQSARMEKALKKSHRQIVNKIEVHVDADWQNYLNKKVYGRS